MQRARGRLSDEILEGSSRRPSPFSGAASTAEISALQRRPRPSVKAIFTSMRFDLGTADLSALV